MTVMFDYNKKTTRPKHSILGRAEASGSAVDERIVAREPGAFSELPNPDSTSHGLRVFWARQMCSKTLSVSGRPPPRPACALEGKVTERDGGRTTEREDEGGPWEPSECLKHAPPRVVLVSLLGIGGG